MAREIQVHVPTIQRQKTNLNIPKQGSSHAADPSSETDEDDMDNPLGPPPPSSLPPSRAYQPPSPDPLPEPISTPCFPPQTHLSPPISPDFPSPNLLITLFPSLPLFPLLVAHRLASPASLPPPPPCPAPPDDTNKFNYGQYTSFVPVDSAANFNMDDTMVHSSVGDEVNHESVSSAAAQQSMEWLPQEHAHKSLLSGRTYRFGCLMTQLSFSCSYAKHTTLVTTLTLSHCLTRKQQRPWSPLPLQPNQSWQIAHLCLARISCC